MGPKRNFAVVRSYWVLKGRNGCFAGKYRGQRRYDTEERCWLTTWHETRDDAARYRTEAEAWEDAGQWNVRPVKVNVSRYSDGGF